MKTVPFRELPGGARQQNVQMELASEWLTERVLPVGSDGRPPLPQEQDIA